MSVIAMLRQLRRRLPDPERPATLCLNFLQRRFMPFRSNGETRDRKQALDPLSGLLSRTETSETRNRARKMFQGTGGTSQTYRQN